MPSWMRNAIEERLASHGVKHSPKFMGRPSQSTQPAAIPSDTASAVRQQAAARSHNTFRPDIYRVSEGYLN